MEEKRSEVGRRDSDGQILKELHRIEGMMIGYGNELKNIHDWKNKTEIQMNRLAGHIESEKGTMLRLEKSMSDRFDALEKQINRRFKDADDDVDKLVATVYGNGRKGLVEDNGRHAERIGDVEGDIIDIKKGIYFIICAILVELISRLMM